MNFVLLLGYDEPIINKEGIVMQAIMVEVSKTFKTFEATKGWLDDMGITNYTINRGTLLVDVYGDVDLSYNSMTKIPVKFGNVYGKFIIRGCKNLTSLIGCPHSAELIDCSFTNIKDFSGIDMVNDIYATHLNCLESFNGLPETLNVLMLDNSCGNIKCIDHFPKTITNTLTVSDNFKLTHELYKWADHILSVSLRGNHIGVWDMDSLLKIRGLRNVIRFDCSGFSTVLNKGYEHLWY